MRYHRRHGGRPTGLKLALLLIAIVLAYAGIIIGIRLIGNRLEHVETKEPVGSVEGRFASDEITMYYRGRELKYRKRALTNLLLIGVDWSEEGQSNSARYGGQSDFLLLLTLDKENKCVSTLQIDRDTMAPIRIYGPFGDYTGVRTAQISLSHAYGDTPEDRCRNTVWSVSSLMSGIPIDGYIAMDIDGIGLLNDALGGVTVKLEDDFTSFDPQMQKGAELTLTGHQAEIFTRYRMGVGEGTNEARMRRQRMYIEKVMSMITAGLQKDLDYAGQLMDRMGSHLVTNLDRGKLLNLAYDSRDFEQTYIHRLAGKHVIASDNFMEFYADSDALKALLADNYFE